MRWWRLEWHACLVMSFLAATSAALCQPSATASPPPPPQPIAFEDAVLRAANDLFSKAAIPVDANKVDLVIDPLIDGVSGAQSVATHAMEKRIVALVQQSYPRFQVHQFESGTLARQPVVLIGTFTAVNNAGASDGVRDAYRICLALADLRTKSIVSKGVARAKPEGIDVTPTPSFADSPVWVSDPATDTYIKTCQRTKLGDPIDPAFAERVGTSAFVSEGILEYDAKHYREALAFYRTALGMPGGEQLRVRRGLYLANWQLNRRDDATEAFGSLVDYGLSRNNLSVLFLFKPGSTEFLEYQQIAAPYPMWLSQIATHALQHDTCLDIVGHTSPTGPPQVNERLSVLRAEFIKDLLQSGAPGLQNRLMTTGVGSREMLIGTGRDDASDAIDRRVDFKVRRC
jgi:outer membrane protein OmpA-like peptidoglycan-associated protein